MADETIDHDRIFKELLTTFFVEFVEAFLPDVAAYLEQESLVFLDKQVPGQRSVLSSFGGEPV